MKRLIGVLLVILALTIFAGAQQQEVLNNDSVVKMVHAGLGESLIVTMIRNEPGKYSVTPDEVIRLKQEGVSEKILSAMVTKSNAEALAPPVPSGPVKIAANTPIKLAVDEALSSTSAKAGDPVKVVAADDLLINKQVVIAKGAPAVAHIVSAKPKGGGHDGQLEIAVDSVKAVDGKDVPVYGHLTVGGHTVSAFRGGHEVQLQKGQIITAVAAKDITVGE